MITRQDERLFRQAAVVAAAGQPHVRVGVVLSKGRTPYAWDCNHSGPTYGEPWLQGHAEMRAMKVVRPKSTIYVARLDRAGKIMPSRPCLSCETEIRKEGSVRKIVYYNGRELKKVTL